MKLYLYCISLSFFLLLVIFDFAYSKENIENQLKEITSKLRCMTCQNQTVYDSDEDFSKDLKKIIIKKLQNGESKEEIINFLAKRYGEYILFEPKIDAKNIFLWTFPFIALLICAIILFIRINRNNNY